MKVCALVNTFNSEEYLWYVLKSIYHFSDRLVIIDGAFNSKMPSHFSTDKTEQIIKRFPDPQNKIIYKRESAKSQVEQRSKVFRFTRNFDWLMIVDDDEIYTEKNLIKLREFLRSTKQDAFKIGGLTFFNSFKWYRWVADPRIWRIKPKMQFIGSNNVTGQGGNYLRDKMEVIPGIKKYHYSYVRNVKRFEIRIRQTKVNKYPYSIKNNFFVRTDIKLRYFEGKHPQIMETHPYRKIKWNPP